MTFRELNARWLEPISQWTMIAGLVFLCQPWIEFLHRYGLSITILGLVGFLVTSHVPPPKEVEEDEVEELT